MSKPGLLASLELDDQNKLLWIVMRALIGIIDCAHHNSLFWSSNSRIPPTLGDDLVSLGSSTDVVQNGQIFDLLFRLQHFFQYCVISFNGRFLMDIRGQSLKDRTVFYSMTWLELANAFSYDGMISQLGVPLIHSSAGQNSVDCVGQSAKA